MPEVEVVRVFVNDEGLYGSPLGVVRDWITSTYDQRASLTKVLGFSETVFIESSEEPRLEIHSLVGEIPFAGHVVVGCAHVLKRDLGTCPKFMIVRTGRVECREDGGLTWVAAQLRWSPAWSHERAASLAELRAMDGPRSESQDATQIWEWEDEARGVVYARTFASRFLIPEEEACGTASMQLAATLGRRLEVHHGKGSVILVRPAGPGEVEIAGAVASDGIIEAQPLDP